MNNKGYATVISVHLYFRFAIFLTCFIDIVSTYIKIHLKKIRICRTLSGQYHYTFVKDIPPPQIICHK